VDLVAGCFVPGLYLVLFWWLLVSVCAAVALAAVGWSPLWAVLLLVTLPRSGDAALGWRDWLGSRRLVQRVRRWSTSERETLRAAAAVIRAWAITL
jgi:hypothetical protein